VIRVKEVSAQMGPTAMEAENNLYVTENDICNGIINYVGRAGNTARCEQAVDRRTGPPNSWDETG
jgi:hypothetical protein